MKKTKILTPSIASNASYALDEGDYFFVGSGGGGGGGYGIILKPDFHISYQYLLGLLNSNLLDYYLKGISSQFKGGFYAYNYQYIKNLPIVIADEDKQNIVEQLVKNLIELNKNYELIKTPHERAVILRNIKSTEYTLNNIIYELYGLEGDEIKSLEESEDPN